MENRWEELFELSDGRLTYSEARSMSIEQRRWWHQRLAKHNAGRNGEA